MSLEFPGPQAVRKLTPGRLVIASHNPGKVREIRELLGPYGVEPVSAAELDLPEPEETGTTFMANAELKARAAADLSGLPALADDSGLCVDALGGEPGIFSARWAEPGYKVPGARSAAGSPAEGGKNKDFSEAMRRVEAAIGATGPEATRDAHFICVLALAWPDGHVEWFEGRADGTLVDPPRGDNGFGYDPMFLPEGGDRTYGELSPDEKHADNHRARAFAKLVAAVF